MIALARESALASVAVAALALLSYDSDVATLLV